jgi:hypothetical protein
MRIFSLMISLFFAAGMASAAWAADFSTPKELLKAVYADADGATYDFPYQPYLSKHLLGLFQAERAASPDEPSNLDWDPVIAGQDGAATNLKIGKPRISGDRATVSVHFTNGDAVSLIYSLVDEDGGWKVDDIEQQGGENPWKVSTQVSGQ